MNGVQTRFKCKLDVKRCKRFVFPPSSLLPRSNALKTKAIRYFQTDRTLTRIVSPPLPENVKGSRFSVYSISEKNDYCRGTLYLSFLANFSSVASSRLGDFIALSPVHTGGNLRARVYVGKIDDEHIRFGTNLLRVNAESFKSHALNKTHLLVLKLDYKKNEVSLFVDPALTAEEPQPDVVAKGDEDNNKLKGGIRSISFRNRDDLTGNVGNFRFSSSWAGVIAQ